MISSDQGRDEIDPPRPRRRCGCVSRCSGEQEHRLLQLGTRELEPFEVGVEQRNAHLPALDGLERESCPHGQLVAAIRVVAIEVAVVTEAVALGLLDGDAPGTLPWPGRTQRSSGCQPGRQHAVVACGDFGVELALGPRVTGTDVDESSNCVGPVPRALRTPQHLNLLDVERRGWHGDAAEDDVVDQEPDGRVGRPLVLLEFADPDYDFPGNVRELENIIERGVALESSNIILPDSLDFSSHLQSLDPPPPSGETLFVAAQDENDLFTRGLEDVLATVEKKMILHALHRADNSKMRAAELLKISFRSLRYKTKKYEID